MCRCISLLIKLALGEFSLLAAQSILIDTSAIKKSIHYLKDKYPTISLNLWNLKNKTNEQA